MPKISKDASEILHSIPDLINKTFPIPARFRSALPSQIAELSRLLTNNRGERSLSYLGRPEYLSAYLHYFLPWNLYRVCLLLQSADIPLSAGEEIADLGSGPLTFASALWIARPDLRDIPLVINSVDRCAPVLKAGKKFFDALSGGGNWGIHLVHKEINSYSQNRGAALVCAVNIFNETYEKLSHNNTEGLKQAAVKAAQLMNNLALPEARILTVEPGVPQSGRFISFLREAFLKLGRLPLSPCTHINACPLEKSPKRWCHFAFETVDAPKELHRLSAAAGIPKERLVMSYLLTGTADRTAQTGSETAHTPSAVRVISDAFPLADGSFGCYGCCAQGLMLLSGAKNQIEKTVSASLIPLSQMPLAASLSAHWTEKRDAKSGAQILEVR